MPHHKKTHADIRLLICGLCLRKPPSKPRLITKTPGLLDNIKTFIFNDYSLDDYRLPVAICDYCRIKFRKDKENFPIYDYSSIPNYINTDEHCTCILCTTWRSNILPGGGRKRKSTEEVGIFCKRCMSEIGRGKRHSCNPSSFIDNTYNMVMECTINLKAAEQLTTKLLKR